MRLGTGGTNLVQLIGTGTDNRADVAAASATLEETDDQFLKSASALYGWDGAKLSRVLVESQSAPNLRTSLYIDGSQIPKNLINSEGLSASQNGLTTFAALFAKGPDDALDGLRTIANANPGFGSLATAPFKQVTLQQETTLNDSDKTFTVPSNTIWHIHSIWVEFSTTATAGSRQLQVDVRDTGDDVFLSLTHALGQVNNGDLKYAWLPGVDAGGLLNNSITTRPMPSDLWLPTGYDLRVYDHTARDAAADDMIVHIQVCEVDY